VLLENISPTEKFQDPFITAKGETRAWVDFKELKTLWFNTGTQCNLTCSNCYIESSPLNDRLSYLNLEDVTRYLDEIEKEALPTKSLGFTGGEPFLNPAMTDILNECLSRGFKSLVLTNAYRVLERNHDKLLRLKEVGGDLLQLRISLDHYTKEIHEEQRGQNTFERTLQSMKWLVEAGFEVSIAGRTLIDEDHATALNGFQDLLDSQNIKLQLDNSNLVLFPEMEQDEKSVPEITTACWDILGKTPEMQMCSSERMVVKRKENDKPSVLACTLLAYDKQFELGNTLKESFQKVQLNHVFCAKFCVLGGSSCSSTL
jgi:molybdenum cofactor biosynthesis enzyme MoaA